MAVKDLNSNPHILPGYHLDLTVFDGQCEADVVMKRFIDIIKTKDASRFQSTVGMLGLHKSYIFYIIVFPNLLCRTCLFWHSKANSRSVQTLPHRGDQLQC